MKANHTIENKYYKYKSNYYLIYTLMFFLTISVVLLCFYKSDKSLLWPVDGLTIQYPALSYLGRLLRNCITNGQLQFFDFHIGMGTDVIQFLGMWYLEPVAFLSALVPSAYSEMLYNCLTILRFYFIGISFLFMCKHFKVWNLYSVTGALIYTFSGYTYYFIKHPIFFWGLIYLPILIVMTDNLIKFRKLSLRFIILIALSFISGYQLLYMNTFFVGLFFMIRYFSSDGVKTIENFFSLIWKLAVTYLLGLGITGALLLPIIHGFITSNRTETLTHINSLFTYGSHWFTKLIAYMFVPNKDTGYWLYNGYAIIVLIAIITLFSLRTRFFNLKVAWCIIAFLFFMPLFTYILFGFNMINHRWSYAYGLLIAFIAALVLPEVRKLSQRKFTYFIIIGLLYTGIMFFVDYVRSVESLMTVVLYWIIVTTFMAANSEKLCKKSFGILTLGLTAVVCALNGYITFSPTFCNYVSEFIESNTANNQFLSSSANLSIDDNSFYRREAADNQRGNLNTALLGEYNGVSICSNEMSENLFQFNNKLENRNYSLAEMYDLDNRTFLETLCGVKYFTLCDGQENHLPFGFYQVDDSDDNSSIIYENTNFLPLGFTYESVLNQENYQEFSSYEKQSALLQGVSIQDGDKLIEKFPDTQITFDHNVLPYNEEIIGNATREDESYHVYEAGASIKFTFKGLKKSETYMRIQGFNADALMTEDINVPVSTNINEAGFSKIFNVRNSQNQYTPGRYDFLINMGYYEEALNEITLTFPVAGDYIIENVEIICQPMEQYQNAVDTLTEDTLADVNIGVDKISGHIALEKSKILYLYIPYSSGWSAFVDGQESKIYKANEMFMAIPLASGSHTVALEYTTPGIKLGLGITVGSCILCFLIFGFSKIWTRKRMVYSISSNK